MLPKALTMVNSFFTSLGDEVILIRKVLRFAFLWTKWGFSQSFTKKMENLAGCSPSQILSGFSGQKQVQIRVKRAYYSKTLAVDAGMFNTSSRSLIIYFMHSVLFFRLWSRTTIKSLCSKDHLLWKTPSSFGEDPCGMLSWRVRCKLYDNSLTLQSYQKINYLNIQTLLVFIKSGRCWGTFYVVYPAKQYVFLPWVGVSSQLQSPRSSGDYDPVMSDIWKQSSSSRNTSDFEDLTSDLCAFIEFFS